MDNIASTAKWFSLAHGDEGHNKVTVQLGVHFEEVAEMLVALKTSDSNTMALIAEAATALDTLASHLKTNSKTVFVYPASEDLLLDSLCDQIVTAVGVGYDYGFKMPAAMMEVNRSNFSKFVDGLPLFDKNGKVMKGPDYTPPNLVGYTK